MADLPPKYELQVDNLGCDRGQMPIFRDVTFHLSGGQALQLFGANGSGKSTILQVLAGLVPGSAGSVIWRGDSDVHAAIDADALVYQGHDAGFKPTLTVRQNLNYWATLYRNDQIVPCLDRVAMAALIDAPVRQLSAGQKRRAGLARCLLSNRPLWFLDEPTAALDSAGHDLVTSVVKEHLSRGNIAVIATHDKLDIASVEMHLSASPHEGLT